MLWCFIILITPGYCGHYKFKEKYADDLNSRVAYAREGVGQSSRYMIGLPIVRALLYRA